MCPRDLPDLLSKVYWLKGGCLFYPTPSGRKAEWIINDEVICWVMKIKILKRIKSVTKSSFQSCSVNQERKQEKSLMPLVDKFRVIQVAFYLNLVKPTVSGETDNFRSVNAKPITLLIKCCLGLTVVFNSKWWNLSDLLSWKISMQTFNFIHQYNISPKNIVTQQGVLFSSPYWI